ncbi:MAG: toprim domain-containing protein [Candidatus Bathyarchaeota archaeon]|nr:toprim domain-containing protein [Candidatus Bathyarchaeota archaeon]
MSTRLKEKEKRILLTLEWLAQESAKEIPIVVEGKKDVEALRGLAIEGKIIEAKTGGKSMLDVISEVEECGAQEVILLLDFDRRGREWTKSLKQYLEKMQIKANVVFWKKLRGIVGREVKDVEGLTSYMETLKRKIYNS